MTSQPTTELTRDLAGIVGATNVLAEEIPEVYTHDEAIDVKPVTPRALVFVTATDQVQELIRYAQRHQLPIVARGSGTGLSGGAQPIPNGIVVSFERMNQILEINTADQTARVEPGVTLAQLEEALAPTPYFYPVYPGEMSSSLGGNVATNAGGMRAIKYGVTRHNVLGLEFVTGAGVTLRSGGSYVKTSSGYDLTQLITGSEGTLALVTQVLVRLSPRPRHRSLLLASFSDFPAIADAVVAIADRGLTPSILEYVEATSLRAMTRHVGVDLGVSDEEIAHSTAFLMVELETMDVDDLERTISELVGVIGEHQSTNQYLLDERQRRDLIAARESAFWTVKQLGANAVLDTVVPRSKLAELFAGVAQLGVEHDTIVAGTGHVGDGNVHLSVFQADPAACHNITAAIINLAERLGGAVSGEHGIGVAKRSFLLDALSHEQLELYRSLKSVFDPANILNPGKLL